MSTHSTAISTNVIIAAGGDSVRMGKNKQLMKLAGKPVIARTMEAFQNHPLVDRIVLIRPPSLASDFRTIASRYNISKLVAEADSGTTRMESINNGLMKTPECAAVLIHNGANPLVTETEITACIKATLEHGAAVVAQPVKDTIKTVNKGGFISKTLNRSELWAMQTPQGIQYQLAKDAYAHVINNNLECTDDVQAVELFSPQTGIKIVPASSQNFKLTTPMDLMLAESILRGQMPTPDHIHGVGEDSHRFLTEKEMRKERKTLIIGGVVFPGEPGLKANSDGDVVYHALCRAMLNALGGKEDIGHFADYLANEGLSDSKIYLINTKLFMEEKEYELTEARIIIEASRPRLADRLEEMRSTIQKILCLGEGCVGISPHSGEKLTAYGKGIGIRAFANVTLRGRM